MTTAANDHGPVVAPIGPATEARILAAFAHTALLSAEATGDLLGMDAKSVRAITDAGALRAVRRGGGSTRAYTEGDIRYYLTESAGPVREAKVTAPRPASSKVVPFSQRRPLTQKA